MNKIIFRTVENGQRFPSEMRDFRGYDGYLAIRHIHEERPAYLSVLRCNNLKKDWKEFINIYGRLDDIEFAYIKDQEELFNLSESVFNTLGPMSPLSELTALAGISCRWSSLKEEDLSRYVGLPLSIIMRNITFKVAPFACGILNPKFFLMYLEDLIYWDRTKKNPYNWLNLNCDDLFKDMDHFKLIRKISSGMSTAIDVRDAEIQTLRVATVVMDKIKSLERKGIVFRAFTRAYWFRDLFVYKLNNDPKMSLSNDAKLMLLKHDKPTLLKKIRNNMKQEN